VLFNEFLEMGGIGNAGRSFRTTNKNTAPCVKLKTEHAKQGRRKIDHTSFRRVSKEERPTGSGKDGRCFGRDSPKKEKIVRGKK